MKTRILVASIALSLSAIIFAQPAMRIQQSATVSTNIRLSSGSASEAFWKIDAGAASGSLATFSHIWSESAGSHTLTVTPHDPVTGCSGEVASYTIDVFTNLLPTDPQITAITSVTSACPTTALITTSTSTVTVTTANIPAASPYVVWYTVGAAPETSANVPAGGTTFTIDASSIAAGGSATVTITKFKVGTDPQVVLASGPTGTLNVNAKPVVTGIE